MKPKRFDFCVIRSRQTLAKSTWPYNPANVVRSLSVVLSVKRRTNRARDGYTQRTERVTATHNEQSAWRLHTTNRACDGYTQRTERVTATHNEQSAWRLHTTTKCCRWGVCQHLSPNQTTPTDGTLATHKLCYLLIAARRHCNLKRCRLVRYCS